MKNVAVVVEGPSDRVFWNRLLWKHFPAANCNFKVLSLNGRDKLIREAPNLSETFRNAKYFAIFFIVDADDAHCASQVLDLFDENFKREIRSQPIESRFSHVFIAFREIESWVLADEACVRALVKPDYSFEGVDDRPPGKAKLLKLCKDSRRYPAGMQDLEFAKLAAGVFNPSEVQKKSASFAHSWTRIRAQFASLCP